MKRKVLTSFYYAADGINAKLMRAGKWVSIHDDHVSGLEISGKIEPLMPRTSIQPKSVKKARR